MSGLQAEVSVAMIPQQKVEIVDLRDKNDDLRETNDNLRDDIKDLQTVSFFPLVRLTCASPTSTCLTPTRSCWR